MPAADRWATDPAAGHPEDVAPFVHGHPTQNETIGETMLKLAGKPLHAI